VNLRALEKLDRRWLFVAMGVLVAGPMLWPLGLPLRVSDPVRQYHAAIEAVPEGSVVLMSCDFDPANRPEMLPMMKSSLRHLFDRRCRVIVTCLWNGGPALVDQTLEEVIGEYRAKGVKLESGVDYVDLGYKAGYEAVMVLMGQGIANAFPRDHRGRETRGLPIMRGVSNYSSFPLLVNISGGYPGTKEWVQQVNSRFHLPMVSGCTAVSAPEYYPYLQSGQLRGMLGGMAGAAEYEMLRGERGPATRGMDAQSLAHLFIAACILLGNVVLWSRAKGGRP
jgi:hypothetical protein